MDPPPAPLLTTRTAAKLKAGRRPNTERVATGSDRAQRSLEAVRAFRERKKQESQLLQTEVERLQAQTVYLESQLQTANQELELLRLTASAAPVLPLYPPPSLAAVTALQQRLTELEAENIVLRRNSVQIEFRDSRISDASCSECVKLRGRLLVALGQVKDLELVAQEAEKQRNQIEPERIAGHTQAVERDGDIIVDGRKVCIADVCGKMETKWARRGMKALESLKDSGDLVDTFFNAYEYQTETVTKSALGRAGARILMARNKLLDACSDNERQKLLDLLELFCEANREHIELRNKIISESGIGNQLRSMLGLGQQIQE